MRGGFQFAYVTSQTVETSLAPVLEELTLPAWENMGLQTGEEAIGLAAVFNYVTLGLNPEPVLRLESRVAATQWKVLKRKVDEMWSRESGPLFRYEVDWTRSKLVAFLAERPLPHGSRLHIELRNSVQQRNATTPAGTLLLSLCLEHMKSFLESDPYSIRNGFRRRIARCARSYPVAERSLEYMREFRKPLPETKPREQAVPSGYYQEDAHVSVRAINVGHFESKRRKH